MVPAICAGLAEEAELNFLMQELRRHLDDPETLVVSCLFYEVSGRKPKTRNHH